jgi:hypothetical protein
MFCLKVTYINSSPSSFAKMFYIMQPFATGLFLHWESDKRNKFLSLDVSIKSDPKALQRFTGRYFSLVQTEIAIVCLAAAAGLKVILFHKAQKNLKNS